MYISRTRHIQWLEHLDVDIYYLFYKIIAMTSINPRYAFMLQFYLISEIDLKKLKAATDVLFSSRSIELERTQFKPGFSLTGASRCYRERQR